MAVGVDGLPDDWKCPSMIPFGGEGRVAEVVELSQSPWKACIASKQSQEAVLVCTTPLRLPLQAESLRPLAPRPGFEFFAALGLPDVEVVSAACSRPQMIGGWDGLRHTSMPLRPCLIPGSTLFIRGEGVHTLHAQVEAGIGADAKLGFNHYVLGAVPKATTGASL